tara:strand:- start:1651 stop:2031 length:381 start_codon:yes stop_codon:yes gene_type:complete
MYSYSRNNEKFKVWLPYSEKGKRFTAVGPARGTEYAIFDTEKEARDAFEEYQEYCEQTQIYILNIPQLVKVNAPGEHHTSEGTVDGFTVKITDSYGDDAYLGRGGRYVSIKELNRLVNAEFVRATS